MSLDEELELELRALDAQGRRRVPRVLDGRQGPIATIDGASVLNLSSNDYLSLAGDARLRAAMAGALDECGAGAGASRLIVGNHRAHVDLEAALAGWLGVGGVRLFASGYAANVGALTALAREGDVIFSDQLNHASIIDGCRLSRAAVVVYPHGDLGRLESALREHRGRRRIVVSETLFSMDGDVIDAGGLVALARRYGAAVILDEAHALGVFGPEGRGVAAGCAAAPDLVVGTLGKAFGCGGAFVASSRVVAEVLWNRARSFVFSTGLAPVVAVAARSALEIVRGAEGTARRERVAARSAAVRAGLGLPAGSSPIIPVIMGDDRRTMAVSAGLLERGVYVQGIRPPTVPEGTARLRISVGADHDPDQLMSAVGLIRDAMRYAESG